MNDVLVRAEALRDLALGRSPEANGEPFAEALLSCCRQLIWMKTPPDAIRLLDAASFQLSSLPPIWRLKFGVIRARALTLAGNHDAAHELAKTLLAEYPFPPAGHVQEWYELRVAEAANLWMGNRAEDALRWLTAIHSDLLKLPDSYPLALCSLHLSAAQMVLGNNRLAKQFALEAVVSARRCGDRFVEGIALANAGRMDRAACRWDAAEESALESLAIFEADSNERQASITRRTLAILHWKRGRTAEATTLAQRCVEDSKSVNDGLHGWLSHLLLGMIKLHVGDFEYARGLFTSGLDWQVPRAESRPSLLTTEFLGDIHLEQGQAEPALKHYDEVWPQALALVPKGDIVAELRRRRAECYLLLGRGDEAYREAKIGLEHCRELGDRYEEAATYRVLGMSAAATGQPAEAKRWFDQGFAYYDDIETPYEWGKLWMAYGDWLRGSHAGEYADSRGALEAYYAAHGHFERMGAAAKLAEANARIAAMMAERGSSAAATLPAPGETTEATHPPRRPRGAVELDRRSAWAFETFGYVTRNRMMLDLLGDVSKLAVAGSPMLILGESGTGKELVANGVHRLSGRKGSFVPINCSALPREVIESELFGHVAGAFTGATRDKPGLFEVCDHGTAFLDEIAEMSVELQSRLLRFLETGEIRRVGANRHIAVDTLVVAATNRERASLERGEGFRPDLYYRLAHAVVVLPPLRRRGEDVDVLVGHFFDEACRAQGKQMTLSVGARNRLVAYAWPGNVRQLRAVLRRLVILAAPGHEIAAHEIQLDDADVAATLSEELEQAERRRMVEALAQTSGSRSDAARMLGMARTTFVTKMKRYGIR